ncbi:MAG TPA: hypothetical protein VGC93_18115 [Thermoanaerobaculia bacterium]
MNGGRSFFDTNIADCDRLVSEDLQAGRRFGDLVIENPFAA